MIDKKLSIDGVLAALAGKFGFVSKEREASGLRIGEARERLELRRSYSFRPAGRAFQMETESAWAWERCSGQVYVVPEREPNPHIIIVGMSGFGKSTLLRSLVSSIGALHKTVIVFDAHNEHGTAVEAMGGNAYDASRHGLNIFELDGLSVAERTSGIVGLFKEVYGLGSNQAAKLGECIWYTYRKTGAASKYDRIIRKTPEMGDLLAEIYVFLKNARLASEKNMLLHLRDRVALLGMSGFSGSSVSLGNLLGGVSSFSLAGLRSQEAQVIYISELLRRLYSGMKDRRKEEGTGMYVVLDEAQFLLDSSEAGASTIVRLMGEGRKYGVGIIVATHMASQLNRRMVANASTFISFYPREPGEVNYVANLMSGGDAEAAWAIKRRLRTMPQHQAVLVCGAHRMPIIVDTPVADRQEAAVPRGNSDAEAELVLEYARRPVPIGAALATSGVKKETLELLLSDGRLDSLDWVSGDATETWLMKHNPALGIRHEVCVRKIGDWLSRQGVENTVIDNSNGPDIMARYNGSSIAVEYETGSKKRAETARMLQARMRSFDFVLVIYDPDGRYRNLDWPASGRLMALPLDEAMLGQMA